ncbi:hypothetical protein [Bradyrhizobium sp. CCBAU 65884]|uniref:hypothetical protein n=1 Tax=Bradyrhizobium sp. CCBAU 65884 TaxID=722477 RepID=UPI002304D7E7|nr:hypothetical protein [Bradyrhizobium sp. CCBAU 65884]
MTDLHSAPDKYLSMRKGLGYKCEHQTRRLADFIASWRSAKPGSSPRSWQWNGQRRRPIVMHLGRRD